MICWGKKKGKDVKDQKTESARMDPFYYHPHALTHLHTRHDATMGADSKLPVSVDWQVDAITSFSPKDIPSSLCIVYILRFIAAVSRCCLLLSLCLLLLLFPFIPSSAIAFSLLSLLPPSPLITNHAKTRLEPYACGLEENAMYAQAWL